MSFERLTLPLSFKLPKGYSRKFIWQDGKSRIVLSYSKNRVRYRAFGVGSKGANLSRSLDWMQEVDAIVRHEAEAAHG